MLGFVPKGPNEVLARRLDRAEPLVCRIERISRQSKPWKQIEICIESLSIAKPWWTETELDEQDDSLIHFSSDHAMGSRNVRLPREDRRMGVADFE